ncbi:hypothetical protein PCANC_02437 [Puccinia coronata f. sp. avenae]|uniref:Ndc10 domain-containing protein n=1 Tax=Puccinia coronata f. sp. avenae TaxID=200324 RepID=A0A2N5W4Z7_9BASI|nr:hypothetical protein PCANC_04399 [Puccinia coronata f. sp. avenae]PLW57311.1 hypothetical protein PCANC_02437 [Puccinia coronata f. sp. avenae]
MGSPRNIAYHRFLSCLCLALSFWVSTLANFTGHPYDLAADHHSIDDLFNVLPPDHQAGVTPPEELMWEGEGFLLCDHLPSEPRCSEPREDLPYWHNLATSIQASPSDHPPYPLDAHSGTPTHSSVALPSELTIHTWRHADGSQDVANAHRHGNVMNPLSNLRTVLQQYPFKPFYRSYFTASGDFAVPQLGKYKDKFGVNLNTIRYHELPTSPRFDPENLPYAQFVGPTSPMIGIMKRIIVGNHGLEAASEAITALVSHYRNLILFMHKIYEETLDNLKMPVLAQFKHQEKMLKWLHQELFRPINSPPPAMGIIHQEYLSAGNDFHDRSAGPVEVKLREYFSQSKDSLELLPTIALWLLNEFKKQYPMERNNFAEMHLLQTQSTDAILLEVERLRQFVPRLGQIFGRILGSEVPSSNTPDWNN